MNNYFSNRNKYCEFIIYNFYPGAIYFLDQSKIRFYTEFRMLLNLKYFKQFFTNDTLQYLFCLCERSVRFALSVR